MERWYTAREIAQVIGMSTRFVQREAQLGRLRSVAVGAGPRPALRFRAADVTAWLQAWTTERGGATEREDRAGR